MLFIKINFLFHLLVKELETVSQHGGPDKRGKKLEKKTCASVPALYIYFFRENK